ncbi:hypothetical protein K458DRAFT_415982 [Lentithecium fluviatile CBS 122367]|uniref:Uncharacterized protein n=1 Tax=Lentithecium fluviatile CBS 122367 TaxID=1168545 RepID=A0A6G1J7T7_9PLEO|nr:hypothetical protein K458DRAFT_415982 [Lentithecium fluviatile CBS 122367]
MPVWSTSELDEIIEGYEPLFDLDRSWWDCFKRLPELVNLYGVALIFDRHGGDAPDINGFTNDFDILQDRKERLEVRRDLFKLLGPNIRELSIRHFQEWPGAMIDKQDVALHKRVLGQLQSLRMNIVHEQTGLESGGDKEPRGRRFMVMF